jgi:hypothetical protein
MSQPYIRPGKEAAAQSEASKDGVVGETSSVVATQSAARNGANDKSQNGIAGIAGIAGGSSWLCDCFGNDNVVATQAAARNDANDKSQHGIAGGSLWPCRVWVYLCGLKCTMWAISFFLVLCYHIIGIFSVKYSARYWFGLTSAVLGVIVGICTAYRDWKNQKEAKAAAERARRGESGADRSGRHATGADPITPGRTTNQHGAAVAIGRGYDINHFERHRYGSSNSTCARNSPGARFPSQSLRDVSIAQAAPQQHGRSGSVYRCHRHLQQGELSLPCVEDQSECFFVQGKHLRHERIRLRNLKKFLSQHCSW